MFTPYQLTIAAHGVRCQETLFLPCGNVFPFSTARQGPGTPILHDRHGNGLSEEGASVQIIRRGNPGQAS